MDERAERAARAKTLDLDSICHDAIQIAALKEAALAEATASANPADTEASARAARKRAEAEVAAEMPPTNRAAIAARNDKALSALRAKLQF